MWFADTVMDLLPESLRTAPMLDVGIISFAVFAAAIFFMPLMSGGLFGILPRAPLVIRAIVLAVAISSGALVLFCAAILVQPWDAPCPTTSLAEWHACMKAGAPI